MLPSNLNPDLVYTYKLSKTIKFLAILDGIFALFAFFF